MVNVTFTVKDSYTQAPIAGAYAQLACTFPSGGTVPFDGHSDSNGIVNIDISNFTPVVSWSVTATNYQGASGSGTPPSTVLMMSTLPPPPPPQPINWMPIAIGLSVLTFVVLGYFAFKK